MAKTMEVVDISSELFDEIASKFSTEERELSRQIIKCFVDGGLSVKVKQYHQPCMKGTFRILCFIKKSAEAVIINNKGMGRDGVSFQVRIDDRNTLNKLDDLNENIKTQILDANGCGHCSSKCDDKRYVFTYQDKEYVKCHFLCNNFTFQNINENDIESLTSIIKNEIEYRQ